MGISGWHTVSGLRLTPFVVPNVQYQQDLASLLQDVQQEAITISRGIILFIFEFLPVNFPCGVSG